MRQRRMLTLACVVLAWATPGFLRAATCGLADFNSAASIEPATGVETNAGLNQWTIDGVNQIAQQWLWYRVGGSGPESALNTLSLTSYALSTGDGHVGEERLFLSYSNSSLVIDVDTVLTGGDPLTRASALATTIKVINNSASAIDFHLFLYADFNLANSTSNQAQWRNDNTLRQSDLGTGEWMQLETTYTHAPSHWAICTDASLLASLKDSGPTNLNDRPSPLEIASGDISWALQWDFNIPAKGNYIVTLGQNINGGTAVPLPSTAWMGFALLALLGVARHRSVNVSLGSSARS